MKRRAFKLLLFLLAGAIINVAVAWGIALFVDAQRDAHTVTAQHPDSDQGVWYLDRWSKVGSTAFHALYNADGMLDPSIELNATAGIIPWWSAGYRKSSELFGRMRDTKRVKYLAEARGFPVVTMWQEFEMNSLPGNPAVVNIAWRVHGGIPLAHGSFTPRSLPLRPIWPGFAINTIFYAAVLWVLFAFPGARSPLASHQARPVCIMRVFAARRFRERQMPRMRKTHMVEMILRCGESHAHIFC